MSSDTIAALASGAGRAGVAVIRISGPGAGPALFALTQQAAPEPRKAALRAFLDPRKGAAIDEGLALWFPGPGSFTGEDVVELHAHGGPAVVAALLEALLALEGMRIAEPGEFTRRAFAHGKLDLTQAEGLADLIDADTDGQRAQALRQMQGALGALYESWRARLIEAMALLEAAIDFPDEDLPEDLAARVAPKIAILRGEMADHLSDAQRGERVRDGYRIAILGAPNAGKSSLLNALARREAAIVSDIPGTTRDVVEVRLVMAGFPVWIADTAGLREAADVIEAEGVRRALARAEEADLRIGLVEAGQTVPPELQKALRSDDVVVASKSDLAAAGAGLIAVSVKTGTGLAELEAALSERVAAALGVQEAPALTRARHRFLLGQAAAALERAEAALFGGTELAAEELRTAAFAVGKLTGRIDVEDLLDDIFSKFCIGK
ncbi:MAG: tRNA uridine-5-carboxymethylaminomethyl(34) synthesis GTPase MnmE [Caulobacterales bacterium]